MNTGAFETLAADLVSVDAIRDCLNESFSDYLIKFPTFDHTAWLLFLQRQGCDLALSRVGVRDDVVIAFSLVTRRSVDVWRIAVMGARPAARGTGIAPRLLDETIASAARHDVRSVELEAFAQNERAVRLYRSRGMSPTCALYGFDGVIGIVAALHDVREVSIEVGARWAIAMERETGQELPWQVCGDAILRLPGEPTCWRLDEAQLVFTEAPGTVAVMSLLDRDPAYRNGARLLTTLRASFPESILRVSQSQAENGPALAFRHAGWQQMDLYQWLIRRRL